MALPAVQADWRGCPPDGNERINALLNCVVEVEAEIPVLHGEEPKNQVMAKVHSEPCFFFGSFLVGDSAVFWIRRRSMPNMLACDCRSLRGRTAGKEPPVRARRSSPSRPGSRGSTPPACEADLIAYRDRWRASLAEGIRSIRERQERF